MRSRERAEIDDIICVLDRLLIVLDDQHGIAQIAKLMQRVEKPFVITRMQADARFVQNIKHTAKLRSDLRRKPNTLAFAAGQGCRRTPERQISKPDRIEKTNAAIDLLQYQPGDLFVAGRELDRGKFLRRLCDRHTGVIRDAKPGNLDRQTFRLQTSAVAHRARDGSDQFF